MKSAAATNTDGESEAPTLAVVPAKPKKLKKSHHKKKIDTSIIEPVNDLGMSPEWWETAKIQAIEQFGEWLDVPMARSALTVRGFDCLDQITMALRVGREIAENDCYPADQRLVGAKIVALASEAQVKMSEHLMKLAEKAAENGKAVKKRNLPPQALAAQVNIYPPGSPNGSTMRIAAATNGQNNVTDIPADTAQPDALPTE